MMKPLLSRTPHHASTCYCRCSCWWVTVCLSTLSYQLLIICRDGITDSTYPSLHVFAPLIQIPFIHSYQLLSSPFPLHILTLSCLVLSCLVLSFVILSYLILSYLILSYLILSYSSVCRWGFAACGTGSVPQPLCHSPWAPPLLTRYSQAFCRNRHTR